MAYNAPALIAGLDIGQVNDPTALAVIQRDMLMQGGRLQPRYGVRALQRVPLGTPYPLMVRQVRDYLDRTIAQPYDLVLDVTGVGRAILDLFRERPETLLFGQHLPPSYDPIAVTLTSGNETTTPSLKEWHVPKRDAVLGLQVVMQQGRIQMAMALEEAPTLVKEIQHFQWKVSTAGQDQYGAWREGTHDDLLLATAIAVWWGERTAPVMLAEQQQVYARHGSPLAVVSGRKW